MNKAIFGLFPYVDSLLNAAERLKKQGYSVTIFSPVPLGHEIEERLGERKNYVKYFTSLGAVGGFLFGTILALGTAALYVLPRGGREIFAIPPTLIISYESAILAGVLFTYLGFLLLSGLPSFGTDGMQLVDKKRTYLPEVSVDSFGLLIEDEDEVKLAELERAMKEHGASEVRRVEES